MALPLALFYAFVCLAPWYMCRFLPWARRSFHDYWAIIWRQHRWPALFWIVVAKGLAFGLSRFNPDAGRSFPSADSRCCSASE